MIRTQTTHTRSCTNYGAEDFSVTAVANTECLCSMGAPGLVF
jgi:hypothetical protein